MRRRWDGTGKVRKAVVLCLCCGNLIREKDDLCRCNCSGALKNG